jgi:SAM-dependent methyltransferase
MLSAMDSMGTHACPSKEIFDIRSGSYNKLCWVFDPGFAQQIMDLAQPRTSDILLDLAAGTGAISQLFQGRVRRIYDLDLSVKMLIQAVQLLADASDIFFIVGDGQCTCFPSEFFDLIVCRNGLHHFADPQRGLRESRRILKSGGFFLLIEPVAPNDIAKPVWSELFSIRDTGRHPDFYFTGAELATFVAREGFQIEVNQQRIVPIPMSNWRDTGSLSREDQEEVYRVLMQMPQNMRHSLGLRYDKGEWVMDHSWTLLRMKREASDGT